MLNDDIYQVLCSIDQKLSQQSHSEHIQSTGQVKSTLNTVSINAEPIEIIGTNTRRVELWIYNDSDKKLFLTPFVGDIGANLFSLSIKPSETLFINPDSYGRIYDQQIFGFFEDGSGRAMITEFFLA